MRVWGALVSGGVPRLVSDSRSAVSLTWSSRGAARRGNSFSGIRGVGCGAVAWFGALLVGAVWCGAVGSVWFG